MLYGEKSRHDFEEFAVKLFEKNEEVCDRKKRRNLYDEVEGKFNLRVSRVEEMITFKRDIKEFTPFEIFCVVWFLDRKSLGKYFTPDEIENLSHEKIEISKAEFPIVFSNMVRVADDQWIGTITVKQLMEMKRSQMLNYDENEQRALRRVKRGEIEIFKPYVSNKNVSEIKESMMAGTYIPDPITLNMPEGSEFSFSDGKLTVYSLPKGMFNLDDGYHRYLAISQIYDFDKDFDYIMELRVVNFSNAKANNFIFQQDQKTPMRKIVSATYDTTSIPNKVISRLNEDSTSNIQGMVGRNNAKINSAALVKLISYYYKTNEIKQSDATKSVIKIKKELEDKFNTLTEQDERFLDAYNDSLLFVVMAVFNSDIPAKKYGKAISEIYNSLSDEELKILNVSANGSIRKKGISIINTKMREVR